MFLNSMPGLHRIFKQDIERPKIILITGPPGSLKSSFVYSLLTTHLHNTGEFGLYTTLEESVASHLRNMESIGVDISLNLQISDYSDLRTDDDGEIDFIKFTEKMITHFKKVRGDKFSCFAFDSLGALYSLMDKQEGMRKRMFHFFRMLRENNLFSLLIMERVPGSDSQLLGNEGFLADGIIYLGLKRRQERLVRYVQVEKMRATRHSMEMFAMEIKENGISVLGPIFD